MVDTVKYVKERRELFVQWCNTNGIRKPAPCLIVNAYNEASKYCAEWTLWKCVLENEEILEQSLKDPIIYQITDEQTLKILEKSGT